jgi:hypothetical protein
LNRHKAFLNLVFYHRNIENLNIQIIVILFSLLLFSLKILYRNWSYEVVKYFVSISFNTSELFQINGNEIKLSIKSKPEHGKANQYLNCFLITFKFRLTK